MGTGFVAPLLIAATISFAARTFQSRLRPQAAARALALSCAAVVITVLTTLVGLVAGALAETAGVDRWSTWCARLSLAGDHVPRWLGLGAALLLAAIAVRVALILGRLYRVRRRLPRCDGSEWVIESPRPTAYALPGRRGGVVVSRGMIDALRPAEQTVMWAHERSHRVHRHDRYLLVAELSVAIVPPLKHLACQIRYATERWADEDAADRVGGDRGLVARAIARAALATVDHRQSVMALAEMGVGDRVQALAEAPPPRLGPLVGFTLGSVLISSVLAGAGLQVHHIVALILHICGG